MVLVIFLTLSTNTRGELRAVANSDWAKGCRDKAEWFRAREKWDSTICYMDLAIQWYGYINDTEGWIDAVNNRNTNLTQAWNHEENKVLLDSALKMGNRLWGEMNTRVADSYHAIGMHYLNEGNDLESAKLNLEKALMIREEIYGMSHSKVADSWSGLFVFYRNRGMLEEELMAAERALEIRQELKATDSLDLGCSFFELGCAWMDQGQKTLARETFQFAIQCWEGKRHVRPRDLASVFAYLGDCLPDNELELAAIYYNQSLEILKKWIDEKDPEVAKCYGKIGFCYSHCGRNEDANQMYLEALNIYEETMPYRVEEISRLHQDIGLNLATLGKFDLALKNYNKAYVTLRDAVGPDYKTNARIFNEMAVAYWGLGETEKSISYLEKALKINRQLKGRDHLANSLIWHNLVRKLPEGGGALEVFEEMENYLELQIQKLIDHPNPDSVRQATILLTLVEITGLESSLFNFRKSLKIISGSLSNSHPRIGSNRFCIAHVLRKMGKLDEALEEYQKSIFCFAQDSAPPDPCSHPSNTSISSRDFFILSLRGKMATLIEMYQLKGDTNLLLCALETMDYTSRYIDELRKSFSEVDNNNLSKKVHSFYESGIHLLQILDQKDPESKALERAFELAEKSKAVLLSEALRETEAKESAGIPGTLLNLEKLLNRQISEWNRQLIQIKNDGPAYSKENGRIEGEISRGVDLKDSLLMFYKEYFPKYYQVKYSDKLPTIEQIQAHLKDGTSALVEYFYGEKNVYIFIVTHDTFKIHQVPNDSKLKHAIQSFIGEFRTPPKATSVDGTDPGSFRKYTYEGYLLYQKLLEPVLTELAGSIDHLIIVPDGPLNQIPFEVLLTEPVNVHEMENSFSQLPYLLKSFRINYSWSSSILMEEYLYPRGKKESRPSELDLVAFAPPYDKWANLEPVKFQNPRDSIEALFDQRRRGLQGRLPKSLKFNIPEVRELEEKFGALSFSDTSANERVFWELAPKARILHISGHGVLNSTYPASSNIALLPSRGKGTMNDGRLYVGEIYNLDLKAELVVLSVCNGGAGKNQLGEGVQSMARAFRYAGCPNVVASQWEVVDETAMQVSLNFYSFLSEGMTTAQALQAAKLKQLREGGTMKSHPYYWAPMVLIGADIPIELEVKEDVTFQKQFIFWGLVLLLISGILLLIRIRPARD